MLCNIKFQKKNILFLLFYLVYFAYQRIDICVLYVFVYIICIHTSTHIKVITEFFSLKRMLCFPFERFRRFRRFTNFHDLLISADILWNKNQARFLNTIANTFAVLLISLQYISTHLGNFQINILKCKNYVK